MRQIKRTNVFELTNVIIIKNNNDNNDDGVLYVLAPFCSRYKIVIKIHRLIMLFGGILKANLVVMILQQLNELAH